MMLNRGRGGTNDFGQKHNLRKQPVGAVLVSAETKPLPIVRINWFVSEITGQGSCRASAMSGEPFGASTKMFQLLERLTPGRIFCHLACRSMSRLASSLPGLSPPELLAVFRKMITRHALQR